mgnify:CR=1 FL=1
MKKKFIAAVTALAFASVGVPSAFAVEESAPPGSSVENPLIVNDPSEVPDGSVEDEVSTYDTALECDVTRSWVHIVPAVEEVSHEEWGYESRTRDLVPGEHHEAVTEQQFKYKKVIPAVDEVSHKEYKYKRTVDVYKTEYQYNKQTREKSRKNTYSSWGDWSDWTWWAGNAPKWSFSDVAVLESGTHGGSLSGTWYREYRYVKTGETRQTKTGTTTETSDWRTTPPEGSGWAVIDTRTVIDTPAVPEKVVLYNDGNWTNEVLSSPWIKTEEKTVVLEEAYTDPDTYTDWSDWTLEEDGLLEEPTIPDSTALKEYRKTGPVKVVDVQAVPEVKTFYAWSDNAECPEIVTPPPPTFVEDCTWPFFGHPTFTNTDKYVYEARWQDPAYVWLVRVKPVGNVKFPEGYQTQWVFYPKRPASCDTSTPPTPTPPVPTEPSLPTPTPTPTATPTPEIGTPKSVSVTKQGVLPAAGATVDRLWTILGISSFLMGLALVGRTIYRERKHQK